MVLLSDHIYVFNVTSQINNNTSALSFIFGKKAIFPLCLHSSEASFSHLINCWIQRYAFHGGTDMP